MDNLLSNFVMRIEQLVSKASQSEKMGEGDSSVYRLPNNELFKPWEHKPASPRFLQADNTFYTVHSFVQYVLRFRLPGTVVICDAQSGIARAWLDYHEPDSPNWRKHTAAYKPELSEEWKKWHGSSHKNMPQDDFAAMIEENERLIVDPPAGQMVKIATQLEGTMSVKWSRATSLQTGLHKIQWVADGNVTSGELAVPKKFTLRMPILLGEAPVEVSNWLRVKIKNPLELSYEIDRPQALLQEAYAKAFLAIEDGLAAAGPVPVYAGAVPKG